MEKELKKYMSNVDEVIALLKKKVERLEGEKKEAEQRADRYEKALESILNTNHDNYEKVIMKVKQIATQALTHKTSSDEHT